MVWTGTVTCRLEIPKRLRIFVSDIGQNLVLGSGASLITLEQGPVS